MATKMGRFEEGSKGCLKANNANLIKQQGLFAAKMIALGVNTLQSILNPNHVENLN